MLPELNVLENTAVHLIPFDGLEQGFKVSFPKAFVFFALNEFKEDGPMAFSEKI